MKQTRQIMGMPITVEIVSASDETGIEAVFDYFVRVDSRYSTYKLDSEISQINAGLPEAKWSREMRQVLALCEEYKARTDGYFDIAHNGQLDPSGLVKGWAIGNAARFLEKRQLKDFFIEAGGDIQAHGHNDDGAAWQVGIRNPFDISQIIKVLAIHNEAVATSGAYIRGQHIYNPHRPDEALREVTSITVIGADIMEADCVATAAFAMGRKGIMFIEKQPGLEGYLVDDHGVATMTSGFERFVA